MLNPLAHRPSAPSNARLGPPASAAPGTAFAARGRSLYRAASAAPAAATALAPAAERRLERERPPATASTSGEQPPPPVAGYATTGSWQLHSMPVSRLPTVEQLATLDHAFDRLRRQLGVGDRWAWQDDEESEEEEEDEVEEDLQLEESEAEAQGRQPQPIVRSGRGREQRSRGRQAACRGRALAGGPERTAARLWGRCDLLPADLQVLQLRSASRQLLTAEQEALLGGLVQAAKLARIAVRQQQQLAAVMEGGAQLDAKAAQSPKQQMQRQRRQPVVVVAAAAAVAGTTAAGTMAAGQLDSVETLPLTLAQLVRLERQGMAARQLLFDCNQRLVGLLYRRVVGAVQLPADRHKELMHAGLNALWGAAGGYQPSAQLRFSTYAVVVIQNAMRDVLADDPLRWPVHVPRKTRVWARAVRGAARGLALQAQLQERQPQAAAAAALPMLPQQQQQQQRGEHSAELAAALPQAVQPPAPPGARQQQQQVLQPGAQPPVDPLQQLAAAARLTPRQALLGLAAARRQHLASLECLVPTGFVQAAGMRQRERAPFADAQGDEEEPSSPAAREAVELVLASLPPCKQQERYRSVLRLRFGLDADVSTHLTGRTGKHGIAAAAAAVEEQVVGLVDFTTVGRQLGISRQRAQQLYHAALASAQQAAAAVLLA